MEVLSALLTFWYGLTSVLFTLYQEMAGVGLPCAEHSSWTVLPSLAVTDLGWVRILGWSENQD